MFYKILDMQFNADRQKWQVSIAIFGENENDPVNPTPVNAFQGVWIDCSNSAPGTVKQACTAFAAAVADATSAETASIRNVLINAATGVPLNV